MNAHNPVRRMVDYTDPANWPSRNPGEPLRDHMRRVCDWQQEQRRISKPELAEQLDRLNAAFDTPRTDYLAKIIGLMIDSGNALIVDEGQVLYEPIVDVRVTPLSDGSWRAAL